MSKQIDEARRAVLCSESWGRYAQASGTPATSEEIARLLHQLEASYTAVIDQYSQDIQAGKDMDKFFPRAYRRTRAA